MANSWVVSLPDDRGQMVLCDSSVCKVSPDSGSDDDGSNVSDKQNKKQCKGSGESLASCPYSYKESCSPCWALR